tara:strand:+ start:4266 stop:6149 length:1884 start_codon:yes stop_codon:yes gene_type:complete
MEIENSIRLVNKYIIEQANLDTLRFITCGSVDDGKSTLIGRMLFESQMIFDDQISLLKNESKKIGTQGNDIDFALLVDGLEAEREQGITIDVAYRFFSTNKRKFIVADTPGHEQYTRNMATGASTADLAIILIDGRKGVLQQTRRHSIICSTIGIKYIIVAINKMDLVDYSEDTYYKIIEDFEKITKQLSLKFITFIPISALKGDNITQISENTNWYKGKSLIEFLENIKIYKSLPNNFLRLPIQLVNRPNDKFRGFSGMIESGQIKIGQTIRVLPSFEKANVKELILFKESMKKAETGQSITVTLDRDIDISRGDVITDIETQSEVSDQFEIKLIWMSQHPGYCGRSYSIKIGTLLTNVQITSIKHKININSFEKLSAKNLEFNDLYIVNIKTDKPIPFEKYNECKGMGALILIDRISNHTVAAGMINFALRRSNNIHNYKQDINKVLRKSLNGHNSKILWFTGLSGSGKSTIANALEVYLYNQGIRTYLLDGDNIRHGINKDLGFSDADRVENIRRISEIAKLFVDAGLVVITAFISPFKAERQIAREMFEEGEFIEIYVNTPLDIAEKRDPKGLYKKARNGKLPNFTGIDSPYEKPENPEIEVSTLNKTVNYIVEKIVSKINFY